MDCIHFAYQIKAITVQARAIKVQIHQWYILSAIQILVQMQRKVQNLGIF